MKIAPSKGFTLGVKAEIKKKKFNLPQVTNKCLTLWPSIGLKAAKKKGPYSPLLESVFLSLNNPLKKLVTHFFVKLWS